MELSKIWLLPPLAFGRVGSSDQPCQSFSWGKPDISPDGSEKTVLLAENTINVDNDGVPSIKKAEEFKRIDLKDAEGKFHPVCPFFELHGSWVADDGETYEGAITKDILKKCNLELSNVDWRIEVANLKAYHYTLAEGDKVSAEVKVSATDSERKVLNGVSPNDKNSEPLSPGPDGVIFGMVQVVTPTDDLPELRIRIYAPEGVVYAPSDIADRVTKDAEWKEFKIPDFRKTLNPNAKWPNYINDTSAPGPLEKDQRVNPQFLAAKTKKDSRMLGLVDDVSDGIIQCTVGNLESAFARIAIGPPDFSPSTRPIVSLQDGLTDRTQRDEIRNKNDSLIELEELEELVADIFERAFETSDLINKDAQNMRAEKINQEDYKQKMNPPSTDFEQPPIKTLWSNQSVQKTHKKVDELPISSRGKRAHRRMNMIYFLKDRLKSDPVYLQKWLRPPVDSLKSYDRRMPALMRGSDRLPMHLTRYQYETIHRWAKLFIELDGSKEKIK